MLGSCVVGDELNCGAFVDIGGDIDAIDCGWEVIYRDFDGVGGAGFIVVGDFMGASLGELMVGIIDTSDGVDEGVCKLSNI
jgi:hypothetical protein